MSDDELNLSFTLPLDDDGFLRRQCPTCEREFKWLASQPDDVEDDSDADDEQYYCPYCGVQADEWLTEQQAEDAKAIVMRQVLDPTLDGLKRAAADLNRSGGLVRADVDFDMPREPDEQTEDITMRRVEFACHPEEPVKVLDDWTRPVFCLTCGTPTAPAAPPTLPAG